MELVLLIGMLAATLTTVATLPQLIKAIKTKKTTDISLVMYFTISCGVLLWLIYGIIIANTPLIYANTFSLIFNCGVLFTKLKYG